jgi:orotate phosphoribosyltransferase
VAEGRDAAGQTVLLVEDVITIGGAVAAAASALRALGATVNTAACAIDRSSAGPTSSAPKDSPSVQSSSRICSTPHLHGLPPGLSPAIPAWRSHGYLPEPESIAWLLTLCRGLNQDRVPYRIGRVADKWGI